MKKKTIIPRVPAGPTSRATPSSHDSAERHVSLRRKWFFRLLAIGIPLAPLVAGELLCRYAGGYGGYPEIFPHLGDYRGQAYFGTNQLGVRSFFHANLTNAGTMHEQVFTLPKEKNEVRILLLGGSAARGFPQPPSRSAASFLEAQLRDLWPAKVVKVHNLGVTAIASFPVMSILLEGLRFEPDLVIVYSGNNEFYGAYGVASVHAFGGSTTAMRATRWLGQFALTQWFNHWRSRALVADPKVEGRARTLMERVIAKSQISPDDSRREAAAHNLARHLRWMVRACRARNVPVLLCTLPANERDMAPIGVDVRSSLSADAARVFEQRYLRGSGAIESNPSAALEDLRAAQRVDDQPATLHYRMGRCLTALGRQDEALAEYLRAKDLDTMPWRAPETLSAVVRDVAREEGAGLCDLVQKFRGASEGGVIGWSLMDDHVHPSLRGQALIAKALLRAMVDLPYPLGVDRAALAKLATGEEYARRLGDNVYDRYGAEWQMLALFRAPFYVRSNPDAQRRAEGICAALRENMSPLAREAIESWKNPAMHAGGHRPITGVVGEALLARGRFEEADRLLSLARRDVPPLSLWNLEFSWDALLCRRQLRDKPLPADLALGRAFLRNAETLWGVSRADNPQLHRFLGLGYNLAGQHERAVAHLGKAVEYVKTVKDMDVVTALVESLLATGREATARRMLRLDVHDPELRAACHELLAELDPPRKQP